MTAAWSAVISRPPVAAVVPVGLVILMTAGQRFPLTGTYPVFDMAAVLIWFGTTKSQVQRRRAEREGHDHGRTEAPTPARRGPDAGPEREADARPERRPTPARREAQSGVRVGRAGRSTTLGPVKAVGGPGRGVPDHRPSWR